MGSEETGDFTAMNTGDFAVMEASDLSTMEEAVLDKNTGTVLGKTRIKNRAILVQVNFNNGGFLIFVLQEEPPIKR